MLKLLPLAALLTLLGLTGGSWHIWSMEHAAIIPSGRYVVAFALILVIIRLVHTVFFKGARPTLSEIADPGVWTLGLVAIFISGWLCRPYNFFQGPHIRVTLATTTVLTFALSFKNWRRIFSALPALATILAAWTFFKQSGGALLFSDDHAMFLFRLQLLKENFPSIPFWSPLWNGGIDARDFFATGALSPFLLTSPLIYLFPIESIYNVIIALILWVFTPLCGYLAARAYGGERVVAAVTALLATTTSLFWSRWALKYGTVGFIVSSSLIPWVTALGMRFISEESTTRRERILLVCATTLMLLWSPSGIALLPCAILALPRLPSLARSRKHLAVMAAILALNLPWMAMMWKVSSVGKFLHSESTQSSSHTTNQEPGVTAGLNATPPPAALSPTPPNTYRHKAGGLDLKKSLKNWQEAGVSANPLVVVLALPAILAVAGRTRLFIGATYAWLVFLGTVGVSLKPQLELDRMLVIAGLVSAFPIAQLIVKTFLNVKSCMSRRLTAAIVGGFMVAGPLATSDMLQNRLYDRYTFAGPEVNALSEAIALHSQGGRALFTGCVLHQLSGGHLAPLPFWSQTPLIATSYAHNIWSYEQPIPESFLKAGDSGIRKFFDLMNVTVVLAHEPTWRRYFNERPNEYREQGHFGEFFLYTRTGITPSYLLEGDARALSQNTHSLTFTPLTERVILKFKYLPFLHTSHCAIRPFAASSEVTLIELSGCPVGEAVTVKSITPYERLIS